MWFGVLDLLRLRLRQSSNGVGGLRRREEEEQVEDGGTERRYSTWKRWFSPGNQRQEANAPRGFANYFSDRAQFALAE